MHQLVPRQPGHTGKTLPYHGHEKVRPVVVHHFVVVQVLVGVVA